MFFAPEGLEDSAQGFNPGSPERARDQVGQMRPIATEKEEVNPLAPSGRQIAPNPPYAGATRERTLESLPSC
jgi:hypothetical protein